jgi:hypothetical protein
MVSPLVYALLMCGLLASLLVSTWMTRIAMSTWKLVGTRSRSAGDPWEQTRTDLSLASTSAGTRVAAPSILASALVLCLISCALNT